ncbi:MAG: hypothetical protein WCR72_13135 [Bacteroidota bacterium]
MNLKIIVLGIVCLSCLFMLASCRDKVDSMSSEFVVSGRIVDTLGTGIKDIKVYYGQDVFVLTDSLGSWQSGLINKSTTIQPVDPDFTFTPEAVHVSDMTQNIIFTARLMPHQNILSENVYAWFTHMQLANGLLESTENSNFVSLYDNALAALVFMARNDNSKAEAVLDFFNNRIDSELRVGKGGFSQFRDKNGTPNGKYWLGDNAWLLIALNNYAAKVDNIKYQHLISELSNWIRSLQDSDGSIRGGYNPDGSSLGKVTEGMIDAFNAVPGYDSFHSKLLNYLEINRWNPSEKLLISWPGNKYQYATDNHSWGFCTFEDFPYSVLEKADTYLTTKTASLNGIAITGYCFDIDKDDVWLEGTGQMVVAFQKAGKIQLANYYLAEMEKLITGSSLFPTTLGIPYASNLGTAYATDPLWTGADTKPCISSSAWYLFGILQFDPLAQEYVKNIPEEDKFWKNY